MTVPKALVLFLLAYAVINPSALLVGIPACGALYLFARWYPAKVDRAIAADREATRAVVRRRLESQARVRELEGES